MDRSFGNMRKIFTSLHIVTHHKQKGSSVNEALDRRQICARLLNIHVAGSWEFIRRSSHMVESREFSIACGESSKALAFVCPGNFRTKHMEFWGSYKIVHRNIRQKVVPESSSLRSIVSPRSHNFQHFYYLGHKDF